MTKVESVLRSLLCDFRRRLQSKTGNIIIHRIEFIIIIKHEPVPIEDLIKERCPTIAIVMVVSEFMFFYIGHNNWFMPNMWTLFCHLQRKQLLNWRKFDLLLSIVVNSFTSIAARRMSWFVLLQKDRPSTMTLSTVLKTNLYQIKHHLFVICWFANLRIIN